MKPILLLAVSALLLFPRVSSAGTPVPYQWGVYKPTPLSKKKGEILPVDWFSREGKKRLARAVSNDFYQLAHAYQPQINPVYASVASAVMVLNAMRLPKHAVPSQPELEIAMPKAMGGEVLPFPAFSQLTFLGAETDRIKDRAVIGLKNVTPEETDKGKVRPGIGLADLKAMLAVYGASAEITLADRADGVDAFRKTAKRVLADSDHFLLVNFKGDVFGAATGGTMSPLGAYDAKSDSVLILDVTAHKNPWYWIPVPALYAAMNTQYDGTWRGYLVVSDGK